MQFSDANTHPRSDVDGLIIGGTPARIEDFYWQVLLIYNNEAICGGSIITAQKILTAAHCTARINSLQRLQIRAGSSQYNSGGVLVTAIRIHQHHQFNLPTPYNNDIALIILFKALAFSPTIGPISPGTSSPSTGNLVTASGYGSTVPGGNQTSNLHSVTVPVVDQATCARNYKTVPNLKNRVTENMLCAGLLNVGGKDSCQGDSGGLCFF